MGEYTVSCSAAVNNSFGEDIFIELFPPSGVSIAIKRVKVTFAILTPIDDIIRQTSAIFSGVARYTTAGSGGVSFTPVPKFTSKQTPSVTTCNIKNGTTGFAIGTRTDKLMFISVNSKGAFEWVARDKDDYLWSGVNERLAITLNFATGATTKICNVECDFIE